MSELLPTAISRPRQPDTIPGYRLLEIVGRGGMGEVHSAMQLSLGRKVAIKLLAANLASDAAFVARFEKEAAAHFIRQILGPATAYRFLLLMKTSRR